MTQDNRTLTLRALDIPTIHKFGIGFDQMFDELMRTTSKQSTIKFHQPLQIALDVMEQ